MEYEHTLPMEMADVLAALHSGNGEDFARALWSAGSFADPQDLDEVLAIAATIAKDPVQWWAIAEAIIVCTQARGVVPTDADSLLATIPDGTKAAESRDEARELIEMVRTS